MGPNSPWNECNPSINYKEKQILLPHDMHKPWQEIKYNLSSSLTNHSLNIPSPFIFDHQGSSLRSFVTHELDNQNPNTPCSSLNYQNPIPPSSSSYLINHRNTISNSSSYIEVLDGLSNQNSISSTSSCLTSCNYSPTTSHKISDNGWNENKIYQEQEMDLDQKSFQLSGTDLDESFTSVTLSLPNMMLNPEHVLQHYPESLSYNQQLFQPSQPQQQKMMAVMDANFSCFGSAMLSTGFTEKEGSFATPTQVDQISKFQEKPSIYKNHERKQKRMIKNRESAARSRAKKQAHIEYLEKECKRLKKNQDRLKKELSCGCLLFLLQLQRDSVAIAAFRSRVRDHSFGFCDHTLLAIGIFLTIEFSSVGFISFLAIDFSSVDHCFSYSSSSTFFSDLHSAVSDSLFCDRPLLRLSLSIDFFSDCLCLRYRLCLRDRLSLSPRSTFL